MIIFNGNLANLTFYLAKTEYFAKNDGSSVTGKCSFLIVSANLVVFSSTKQKLEPSFFNPFFHITKNDYIFCEYLKWIYKLASRKKYGNYNFASFEVFFCKKLYFLFHFCWQICIFVAITMEFYKYQIRRKKLFFFVNQKLYTYEIGLILVSKFLCQF